MASPIKVPFVDLARQFRALETELTEAFQEVGRSGMYIMGERLASFERAAAAYLGVKHAIGVSDGSNALFLSMKALGIGAGDEVITAPNSFLASAWTIVAVGARPIFVDVAEDMNLDPAHLEAAITPRTRAVMPVHITGRPANMGPINEIANRHGLFVIEDAAQAIGARYHGKRVGGLGTAAGFSLHPLKNLGVYGDGGLITTDDNELATKLGKLRNHGLINRDECESWGYNSRLDPMQAAFAEIKLAHLDGWNARCRAIAATYRAGLDNVVTVPRDQQYEECVYHNFIIRTDRRDELMRHLLNLGVDTRIHYPIPIHLQKAACNLGYREGSFPRTESDARRMISLPIYPELTDTEVDYVVQSIRSFFC
jgi:dTDP-4-amino-4,6-dideoxygalactose transaminase